MDVIPKVNIVSFSFHHCPLPHVWNPIHAESCLQNWFSFRSYSIWIDNNNMKRSINWTTVCALLSAILSFSRIRLIFISFWLQPIFYLASIVPQESHMKANGRNITSNKMHLAQSVRMPSYSLRIVTDRVFAVWVSIGHGIKNIVKILSGISESALQIWRLRMRHTDSYLAKI